MKKLLMSLVGVGGVMILSTGVFAEPVEKDRLSFANERGNIEEKSQIRLGHISGMERYKPYHSRYTTYSVDTEIAAFEEVEEDSSRYTKPQRNDRIH